MITYIIRLEENAHSCKMAQECYDQAVVHGLQPKFFKAINGNDTEVHYARTGIFRAKKFKKNRLGVRGCFFSHYYLWKTCVELNEPIIILEHDGYFIKSIDSSILDTFEDVLKLDRHDPYGKHYDSLVEQEKNNTTTVINYNNLAPKAGGINYFKGAYSYIIKPSAAQKLIDYIADNGHLPADQQIREPLLDLKVTVPTVARLHPFYALDNNINSASLTKHL